MEGATLEEFLHEQAPARITNHVCYQDTEVWSGPLGVITVLCLHQETS